MYTYFISVEFIQIFFYYSKKLLDMKGEKREMELLMPYNYTVLNILLTNL